MQHTLMTGFGESFGLLCFLCLSSGGGLVPLFFVMVVVYSYSQSQRFCAGFSFIRHRELFRAILSQGSLSCTISELPVKFDVRFPDA